MNHVNKKSGFTLIELVLAMGFISVLLLAIAMTILQISSVYNRGMIVKEVNQTGRNLETEMQASIRKTAPFQIDQQSGSRYYIQGSNPATGGRLCLGQYSYIWNYGSVLQTNTSPARNRYSNEALLITAATNPIRLVKVYDTNASYCSNLNQLIDPTSATELLNVGDHSLVVHDFSVSSSSTAEDTRTNQKVYTLMFTIGTNDRNALLTDANGMVTGCKAPNAVGADVGNCVVQKFSIAVRAGNVVH
jgi:type II secretory pathway pseudopilin PulG